MFCPGVAGEREIEELGAVWDWRAGPEWAERVNGNMESYLRCGGLGENTLTGAYHGVISDWIERYRHQIPTILNTLNTLNLWK